MTTGKIFNAIFLLARWEKNKSLKYQLKAGGLSHGVASYFFNAVGDGLEIVSLIRFEVVESVELEIFLSN